MEPWYAVGCGLILTWCGYALGKQRGFYDGIDLTIELLLYKNIITKEQIKELSEIDLNDS